MTATRASTVIRGSVPLWTEVLPAEGPTCLLVGGAKAISSFWADAFCAARTASGYRVIRYTVALRSFPRTDEAGNPE